MELNYLTPLNLNLKIIKKFGLWQDESSSKIYSFYGIVLHCICLISFTTCYGVNFYKKLKEAEVLEIVDTLIIFVSAVGITSKAICFVANIKEIKVMLKSLDELLSFETFQQSKTRVNLEKRTNQMMKFEKYFFISTFVLIIGTIIQAVTDLWNGNKQIKMETWFYSSFKDSEYLFGIFTIHQILVSTYGSFCAYSLDTFPAKVISFTAAAFEELSEEISLRSEKLSVSEKIKIYIEYHNKVKKMVDAISSTFSCHFICQAISGAIILCAAAFLLSTVSFQYIY